eukprot:1759159-Amphidinium_carterae.1
MSKALIPCCHPATTPILQLKRRPQMNMWSAIFHPAQLSHLKHADLRKICCMLLMECLPKTKTPKVSDSGFPKPLKVKTATP